MSRRGAKLDGPDPKFMNEEWRAAFLAMVRIGMPPYLAAEAQGVHRTTYFVWARKGGHPDFTSSQDWIPPEHAEAIYRDCVREVMEAEANCVNKVTEAVYQKASVDPDFGLKWLRHRRPEDWNPNRNTAPTVVIDQGQPGVRMSLADFRQMQREANGDEE